MIWIVLTLSAAVLAVAILWSCANVGADKK